MLIERQGIRARSVLMVAVGVSLVGCGAGSRADGPVALPASVASSAPLVHPTGSPPTAAEHRAPLTERQAVRQVVRHYYAAFNALHRDMDPVRFEEVFTRTCPCQVQVRAIRQAAARGEHYVDRVSINAMRASVQDARHAFVLVNLDTARGGLARADGSRVTSAPPRRGVQRVFRLVRVGRRWLISRIEVG